MDDQEKNKDKYVDIFQKRLDSVKSGINDLEKKLNVAKDDVKDTIKKELDELQKKKKVAEEKLSHLKGAGGSAWDELKVGLENAWHELESGFTKTFSSKINIEYKDFCDIQEIDPEELINFFKEKIAIDPSFQQFVMDEYRKEKK